jgi:integrase
VRAWHQAIEKPYAANRALALLKASFYWRLLQEDDSHADRANKRTMRDASNPCAGVTPNSERPRQVRLERDQLPALEKAIDQETSDPYLRAFFRFVLAVGCRRSEALSLKWSDVGDDQVTFSDTKNGTTHTVPLTKYAAKLVHSLPRVDRNPYVFVGRVRGSHLHYVAKAWQRIRKAADIEHIRLHDLRRSFGSWLGDAGFTSKQIGSVLNHKSDITSRVYMTLGDESKRAAVTAMDKLLKKARKPARKRSPKKRTAKVIPFPKAATP